MRSEGKVQARFASSAGGTAARMRPVTSRKRDDGGWRHGASAGSRQRRADALGSWRAAIDFYAAAAVRIVFALPAYLAVTSVKPAFSV